MLNLPEGREKLKTDLDKKNNLYKPEKVRGMGACALRSQRKKHCMALKTNRGEDTIRTPDQQRKNARHRGDQCAQGRAMGTGLEGRRRGGGTGLPNEKNGGEPVQTGQKKPHHGIAEEDSVGQ